MIPYSQGTGLRGPSLTGPQSVGALTATSVTNSSLTSGRVPFATTGGLMTDSSSLTFSGTNLVAPVMQVGSGSAGAPSFVFSTETNTGIYRPASGVYAIAVGGVDRFRFGSNQFTQNFNTTTTGTGPITSVGTVTIHGADAAASNIAFCAYGNNASVIGRRANGTAAALTALAANDIIFSLNAVGYETVTPAFTTAKQLYRVIAAEAFTDVANGTYQDWYNVPIGSTGATFRMRLNSTGSLLIGTATDGMTAGGSLAVAQDFAHRGANLGLFNTTPIAKKTGYGTPTGNAYQASFAAGSITLPNLAAAVAQLILDLKAYGLIGA